MTDADALYHELALYHVFERLQAVNASLCDAGAHLGAVHAIVRDLKLKEFDLAEIKTSTVRLLDVLDAISRVIDESIVPEHARGVDVEIQENLAEMRKEILNDE
jgi:hypothetical protein